MKKNVIKHSRNNTSDLKGFAVAACIGSGFGLFFLWYMGIIGIAASIRFLFLYRGLIAEDRQKIRGYYWAVTIALVLGITGVMLVLI